MAITKMTVDIKMVQSFYPPVKKGERKLYGEHNFFMGACEAGLISMRLQQIAKCMHAINETPHTPVLSVLKEYFGEGNVSISQKTKTTRTYSAGGLYIHEDDKIVTEVPEPLVPVNTDEPLSKPLVPFCGSGEVYLKNDPAIQNIITDNSLEETEFVSMVVCNLTDLYILQLNDTPEYYTHFVNEDVKGSLADCITFLQDKY